MALKYAGDALLVYLALGRGWMPADYLLALWYSPLSKLAGAPTWLLWSMGLWSLPFIVLGVHLTMRRAIDVRWTPWIALAFFIPFVNYGLMLALCVIPAAPAGSDVSGADATSDGLGARRAWVTAVATGTAFGVLLILFAVYAVRSYAAALFLGTPYAVGVVTGFLLARRRPETGTWETGTAGATAVAVIGTIAILTAFEGLVCVVMALPLSLPLAVLGATTGRAMATRGQTAAGPISLGLVVLPAAMLMEPAPGTHAAVREVLTTIEIAAPPSAVWPIVVAFPPMAEPTDWIFRAGIAYPRSARIVGSGAGAIRYCEFSTGAFVEPITAWEPDRRLAFSVTDSPAPLQELSPYATVRAPHLDGYLRSRRGEFRLVALPDGRTRLEGRTWYELDMAPEWYWRGLSDWTIHRIHARVLQHIKVQVEASRPRPPG